MRKHLETGMCALAVLLICADAVAIAPESQRDHYQAIPDRNAFGLKPPQQKIVDTPPPSLPKLILTGITTILGNKRALLKAVPLGNAPGQPAKEESMILTEGQREGNVEVLNIDENAGSVRVNNSGTIMTLTFEKDGPKLTNTPPAAAPPSLPGPTNASVPSALPAIPPPASARSKQRSVPSREVRSPNSAPTQAIAPANVAAPGAPQASDLPPGLMQNLTPEEQAIVLDLQRQAGSNTATLPSAVQTPVPGSPLPAPQAPVLPQ